MSLILFALVAVSTVWAHHTDNMYPTANLLSGCSPASICLQDNSTFTYFRGSSLSANAKTNVFNVLTQKYDPTDLVVSEENPPVYSGSAETDVIYRVNSGAVPPTAAAITVCDDVINSLRCDQFYISFRDNTIAINDAIACHETGHSVGLTHGDVANPIKANSDQSLECLATPAPYVLSTHSVPQINANY